MGPQAAPERGLEKVYRRAASASQRWLEEPADLVRLRRLHPALDEELLLRLPAEFDRQFAGREMEARAILEKFDETLSNAVQLAPREGLLARDPDAELDRHFREQVEPLRETRRGVAEIRTRGFVHSVALGRDPGQAKLLAYTAGAIRERVKHSEFLAATEREPARGNVRDQFVSGILAESEIRVVPLAELRKCAHDVAPMLRAEGA